MHKKTLLATLIFGLLAGQAVAAPICRSPTTTATVRNRPPPTPGWKWISVPSSTTSRP